MPDAGPTRVVAALENYFRPRSDSVSTATRSAAMVTAGASGGLAMAARAIARDCRGGDSARIWVAPATYHLALDLLEDAGLVYLPFFMYSVVD